MFKVSDLLDVGILSGESYLSARAFSSSQIMPFSINLCIHCIRTDGHFVPAASTGQSLSVLWSEGNGAEDDTTATTEPVLLKAKTFNWFAKCKSCSSTNAKQILFLFLLL